MAQLRVRLSPVAYEASREKISQGVSLRLCSLRQAPHRVLIRSGQRQALLKMRAEAGTGKSVSTQHMTSLEQVKRDVWKSAIACAYSLKRLTRGMESYLHDKAIDEVIAAMRERASKHDKAEEVKGWRDRFASLRMKVAAGFPNMEELDAFIEQEIAIACADGYAAGYKAGSERQGRN